jgi:hypothetical protein
MTRKDNRLRISAIESCECLALNNEWIRLCDRTEKLHPRSNS